jgi:hypothetical protein
MNKIKILASVFLSAIVFSSCATVELNSEWAEKNIIIDGLDNEWAGSYKFLEDQKAVISARHDSTHLYLVFKTMDNQVMQKIISSGLTVWIDPSGDEKKSFGIHYPIGMMDWNKSRMYDPTDWGTPEEREKKMQAKSRIMLGEMEIITSDGRSQHSVSIYNPYGIEIALNDTSGALIYEMKIPINSPESSLYSYSLTGGAKLSIGIETGEMDKKDMMAQRSGGGMPEGGMGGGKGGGKMGKSGGKGRNNPDAMKNMLEPVKFWINLTFAKQEPTGQIKMQHQLNSEKTGSNK